MAAAGAKDHSQTDPGKNPRQDFQAAVPIQTQLGEEIEAGDDGEQAQVRVAPGPPLPFRARLRLVARSTHARHHICAAELGVSSMPTFLFFKNGEQVGMLRGADEAGLRERVDHFASSVAVGA